jgi:hypothetical protein
MRTHTRMRTHTTPQNTGKYVPQLAVQILEGQAEINLQGYMVGNPSGLPDNGWGLLGYYQMMRDHGIISALQFDSICSECHINATYDGPTHHGHHGHDDEWDVSEGCEEAMTGVCVYVCVCVCVVCRVCVWLVINIYSYTYCFLSPVQLEHHGHRPLQYPAAVCREWSGGVVRMLHAAASTPAEQTPPA